jgi:hypothetical protein
MSEPQIGERVLVKWGPDAQVMAEVMEVYGPDARRHVLVLLTPEVSDDVVDQPTTLALPMYAVEQVETA